MGHVNVRMICNWPADKKSGSKITLPRMGKKYKREGSCELLVVGLTDVGRQVFGGEGC